MLTRKPKRSELLPLFLGQPLAMTVLMLIVTLALSVLVGVGHFIWNLFHPGGVAAFLPTQDVVIAAICLGIGLGVFNIAGDSAEMDAVLQRHRPSGATYLLVGLSLTLVAVAINTLVTDTFVTQYVSTVNLSLIGTLIVAVAEVWVVHWHFGQCQQEEASMRLLPATKN